MPRSTGALDPQLLGPHLWRGDGPATVCVPSIPSGHPGLDELLPGGGWPRAAVTELRMLRPGVGELSLLLPALARLSSQDQWVALVNPPHLPGAAALAAGRVNLSRLLVLRCQDGNDTLWAMEQSLGSGACAAVLGWPSFLNERALRRLQLAAERGRAFGVCLCTGQAPGSSLAALRLQLRPAGGRLEVTVLKVRGHGTGRVLSLEVHPELPAPAPETGPHPTARRWLRAAARP